MTDQPITLESIKARREADRVKPCRMPSWEEIDFLLALIPTRCTSERPELAVGRREVCQKNIGHAGPHTAGHGWSVLVWTDPS